MALSGFTWGCIIIISSTILIIGGIINISGWSFVYTGFAAKDLVIKPGSKRYPRWEETAIPSKLEIHMFSWANPNDVISSDWKTALQLTESGPYVFLEHRKKVNITWHHNGTVTYRQKRTWIFDPDSSKGSLDDEITIFNPLIASVGNLIRDSPNPIKSVINDVINNLEKSLVTKHMVKELLFDGYYSELMRKWEDLKLSSVPLTSFNFGWLYQRNASDEAEGDYTMYTGDNNIDNVGLLQSWNGKYDTNAFDINCGAVDGSAGDIFPPMIQQQDSIRVFFPDMCSAISLKHKGEEEVMEVIGSRYEGNSYVFDNGYKYSNQKCFRGERELFSGVRDISKCKNNLPVFISFPHFYLADPAYTANIEGLKPNKDDHETYITVEPFTGTPLEIRNRFQVNLKVEPVPEITYLQKVNETYIPQFWFTQSTTISKQRVDRIKPILNMPNIIKCIGWGMLALGVIFFAIGLGVVIFAKKWKSGNLNFQL